MHLVGIHSILLQVRYELYHGMGVIEQTSTFEHVSLDFLIVLGFNNTSTLVGHFVSSPREREKRDRRDSRGEGQGTKKNRNESEREEREEIKTLPLYPYLLQG